MNEEFAQEHTQRYAGQNRPAQQSEDSLVAVITLCGALVCAFVLLISCGFLVLAPVDLTPPAIGQAMPTATPTQQTAFSVDNHDELLAWQSVLLSPTIPAKDTGQSASPVRLTPAVITVPCSFTSAGQLISFGLQNSGSTTVYWYAHASLVTDIQPSQGELEAGTLQIVTLTGVTQAGMLTITLSPELDSAPAAGAQIICQP